MTSSHNSKEKTKCLVYVQDNEQKTKYNIEKWTIISDLEVPGLGQSHTEFGMV